jgi:hypothetical protein
MNLQSQRGKTQRGRRVVLGHKRYYYHKSEPAVVVAKPLVITALVSEHHQEEERDEAVSDCEVRWKRGKSVRPQPGRRFIPGIGEKDFPANTPVIRVEVQISCIRSKYRTGNQLQVL